MPTSDERAGDTSPASSAEAAERPANTTPAARSLRLVTFLGTGNYQQTHYTWRADGGGEPQAIETSYVARALAEFLGATDVVVLATQAAAKQHFQRLRQALTEANQAQPCSRRIPEGARSRELWEQFETIKRVLRAPAHTEVVLDITHGFRAQPFFTAAVLFFLRAVDPSAANVRVVYGAFIPGQGETPIWELTPFVELVDWTLAIRQFLRTGYSEALSEVTETLGKSLHRAWFESGAEGREPRLTPFARALEAFGKNLVTVRTGPLLLGAENDPGSAAHLRRNLRLAREDTQAHLPPLADVLDRVEAMAAPLVATDLSSLQGQAAIAHLARVYLERGRLAEAIATVREGWITRYANPTGANPSSRAGAETDEAFEERRKEAEDDWKLALGLDPVYKVRNDLLHAGYNKRALPAHSLFQQVTEQVERFDKTRGLFINLSNHPSSGWSAEQRQAALELGTEIEDIAFPVVPPDANPDTVEQIAVETVDRLPPAVTCAMVMGELTLTAALVRRLQQKGIRCLAATTERHVETGSTGAKLSRFAFVRFRDYPPLGD